MAALPKVAIVGAGPSGLFLAQALRRANPQMEIDVLDRLLTPFGLIRYGVACDHQGVKAISRQFERLFEREGVEFFGGVRITQDGAADTVALDDLRNMYHAVCLTMGLSGDRRLGIPGEDLAGVIGSGRLTRWINRHPDERAFMPALGARVVVVGAGNVALDVARLLAKTEAELNGSDMCPERHAHIRGAGVKSIDVVARGGLNDVRFEASMVREFARLTEAHVSVLHEGVAPTHAAAQALVEIDGSGAPRETAPLLLTFRFNQTPQAIMGDDAVRQVQFSNITLPADTVVSAIGFEADAQNIALRSATDGSERIAPGLYAAGWFRRGPRGTIPDNRADAKAVADLILADLTSLDADKPGRAALAQRLADGHFSYTHWQQVDAAERAAAPAERVRRKIDATDAMRAATRSAQ